MQSRRGVLHRPFKDDEAQISTARPVAAGKGPDDVDQRAGRDRHQLRLLAKLQ